MSSALIVFLLISLLVVTLIFMIAGALTSRNSSTTRSMHALQFWFEWTWIIALILEAPVLYIAYGHWPGHSHAHNVLVVSMWACIGLLVLVFLTLQQVPNRFQGPRGKKLPQ